LKEQQRQKFDTQGLEQDLINNLNSLGYEYMTPIQEKALPYVLEKKDLIAKAKTGSGKTVAFGLGAISNLDSKRFRIQSLILTPTRELASQVATTIKTLVRYQHNVKVLLLTGGVPYKPQVHSLSHQAHILVGTPGRVLKHLDEANFNPEEINTFVLDEADRMLDMGFSEDIHKIENYLPKKRQTLLFSATYPNGIEKLSQEILNKPIKVEVESTHNTNQIKQYFYNLEQNKRDSLVLKCFDKGQSSVIIFCNTKLACDELCEYLDGVGLETLVLHSDFEQKDRDETLILFANKSYPVLIATDVASRGLDVDDVDMVINYELPNDFEVYTHRIGRTARAGKNGKVISFIDDLEKFDELQEYLEISFSVDPYGKLEKKENTILGYEYSTLYINGGKKHKLRAGDILGALTAGIGLKKDQIGKIDILPTCSYVAIKNGSYDKAFKGLNSNKMKNRCFKVYKR
jgi:ATP-dependent RNA helicase DbpA